MRSLLLCLAFFAGWAVGAERHSALVALLAGVGCAVIHTLWDVARGKIRHRPTREMRDLLRRRSARIAAECAAERAGRAHRRDGGAR